MIKTWLRYIVTLFAPSCMLILYVFCIRWADIYARRTFSQAIPPAVQLAGNIIIGIYLFFICKRTFISHDKRKSHIEYLLSILIVVLLFAMAYIPAINFGILNLFLLSCFPQFLVISTVSVALYIYERKHLNNLKKS